MDNKETSFLLVDRIERPRVEHGCDWGAVRIVLTRYGLKELWWRPGHKCWSSRGHQRYVEAQLQLASHSPSQFELPATETLVSGCRLSRKLFIDHFLQISEFFGVVGVAKQLDPKRSLVITDLPKPSPMMQTVTLTLSDGTKLLYSGRAQIGEKVPDGLKVIDITFSVPKPLPPGCSFETLV